MRVFYKCPSCGELFASDTQPFARCVACNVLLRVSAAEIDRKSDRAEPRRAQVFHGVAWEQEGASLANAFGRYVRTLRQLLLQAPQFFFTLGQDEAQGSARRAERFAYIAALIGFAGFFSTQLLLYHHDPSELQRLLGAIAEASGRSVRPGGFGNLFTWGLALTPLLALLPAHIAAGLYHLAMMLFVRERRSYELTFRVAAYGMAPLLLLAIPPIGPLLAPGWILALHWVGLAAGHRMPLSTALFVLMTPLLSVAVFFMRMIAQLLMLSVTTP